jgi:hypothetical protein
MITNFITNFLKPSHAPEFGWSHPACLICVEGAVKKSTKITPGFRAVIVAVTIFAIAMILVSLTTGIQAPQESSMLLAP